MNVTPLPREALSGPLADLWDSSPTSGSRLLMQVMGRSRDVAAKYWDFYRTMRYEGTLGTRLTELIRVVAASTTACQVCLGSSRDESTGTSGLTREEIAGLVDGNDRYSPGELAAMTFTYKLGTDHSSIDAGDFAALHASFTDGEIAEIGVLAAQFVGMGRLSAVLQLEDPVCHFAGAK